MTPKRRSPRRSPHLQRRAAPYLICTGLTVTLLVLAIHIFRPALFSHIEHKTFDVLLAQTRLRPPSPIPVLIAADDRALDRYGQWPWPRHHLARLISRLSEAGVAIVALDLVLVGQDRSSPLSVQKNLQTDFHLHLPLDTLPPDKRDYDRMLAKAMAHQHTVLGYKFLFNGSFSSETAETCRIQPVFSASAVSPLPEFSLYHASAVTCSLSPLTAAARGSGFINALSDGDGVLRRVPLLAIYDQSVYPSLMLATAMAHRSSPAIGVGCSGDGGFVQLDRQRIHLDPQGRLLLRYRGPRKTFPTYSVAEIMEGSLPDLNGCIAIVGTAAPGLGDLHVTPLGQVFPGIEVHATALDNILQDDFLVRPPWASGAEAVAVVAAGLLVTWLIVTAGPIPCIVVIGGAVLAAVCTSWRLLDGPGIWLSPLALEMALVLTSAVVSFLEYGLSRRELRVRNQQLVKSQDATISSLMALAETRDNETGGHIRRTREYVRILARGLAQNPKYRRTLDPETIELLYKTAPLHDIGKVGIADHILLKPGRLTDAERKEMENHTLLGAEALAVAEEQSFGEGDRTFLSLAREITISHHEKWDGSGYPHGLKGEQIPLGGRLMALADVYDALISKRVYKGPLPHEKAAQIIVEGRGTHFDPDVVDVFVENQERFREIASRYA